MKKVEKIKWDRIAYHDLTAKEGKESMKSADKGNIPAFLRLILHNQAIITKEIRELRSLINDKT